MTDGSVPAPAAATGHTESVDADDEMEPVAYDRLVADGGSSEVLSRRARFARWRERARFDACVRADHVFLVDGHTLNIAGVVDRRVIEAPLVLVVSPDAQPTANAARVAVTEGRSRSVDVAAFSAHLDLTSLYGQWSGRRPPTMSLWMEGLRDGPRPVTIVEGATTGRNSDVVHDIPPARDLGVQLAVVTDHLGRVGITARRLAPQWFPLRVDLVDTDVVVLCRPSPLGSEPARAEAVGPEGTDPLPCTIERRGDHVAIRVDVVALSDVIAPGHARTWTVQAAADGRRPVAIGRVRSDLRAPVDTEQAAATTLVLPDRRLTVTTRWTRRSLVAIEVRRRRFATTQDGEESGDAEQESEAP